MKPPSLVATGVAALVVATSLLVPSLLRSPLPLLPCLPAVTAPSGAGYEPTGLAALADVAVYYATTPTVPQQSRDEISLALAVLRRGCWCSGGVTVFLEEDPEWHRAVRSASPFLRAHLVSYRTRLDQADLLFDTYRRFPSCVPATGGADDEPVLRGNAACPLALHDLPPEVYEQVPPEVYEQEWDVLVLDAPKGYFASAPGRMAAMARARRGQGDTDVFLHDVDRKVEKMYAEEFLCDRFRVGGASLLWHFSIPPVSRPAGERDGGRRWREAVLLTPTYGQ